MSHSTSISLFLFVPFVYLFGTNVFFQVGSLQLLCELSIERDLVHEVSPSQCQEFHPRDQMLHPITTEVLTQQEYNHASVQQWYSGCQTCSSIFIPLNLLEVCTATRSWIYTCTHIGTCTKMCHVYPLYTIHYFIHMNIFF